MNHAIKVLMLGLCLSLPGFVTAADDDPDQAAAHTRHALMELMGWNMASIVAMSTGKAPFDAERAAILGARIDNLAEMIGDAFARNTSGSAVRTAALDSIWVNPAEFGMKAEALIVAANDYADAAPQGEAVARKAFIQLGGACKSCHEDFKAED